MRVSLPKTGVLLFFALPLAAFFLVAGALADGPAEELTSQAWAEKGPFFSLSWGERAAIWDITQPRGKTRQVDFDTDEGTWMSLDVSPIDGSIVFDLLGHIYLIPSEGGEARALTQTSGIAVNYHPRFSPEGDKIAFISDRAGQDNVWIMDVDGSNPEIVHDDVNARYAEPEWSPDGQYIYATRFAPNARGGWTKAAEIWRLSIDTTSGQKLLGSSSTQVWTPSPSADGRYLYYHQASEPIVAADGYYKISDGHHIRRLDLKNNQSDAITSSGYRWYYRRLPFYNGAPVVSPSGRYLAFVRELPNTELEYKSVTIKTQTGLFVRDLETGEETLLVKPVTPAQFKTHSMYHIKFVPAFAWTAQEDAIVFSEAGKIRKVDIAGTDVSTIPFRARVRRELSEQNRPDFSISDEPITVKNIRRPALSPNGRLLAFEAIGAVWVKALPDGKPRPVSKPPVRSTQFSPSWSPDGRRVVYGSWSNEETGSIWSVAIGKDGIPQGAPKLWTSMRGEYLNPVFSADGSAIIVLRSAGSLQHGSSIGSEAHFDLISIREGANEATVLGTVRRVDMVSGQSPSPSVDQDGRILVVQRDGDAWDKSVLTSISADGDDMRTEAVFDALSAEARISPDGEWLAFQHGHNIHIAERPGPGPEDSGFFPLKDATARLQAGRNFKQFMRLDTDGLLYCHNVLPEKQSTSNLVEGGFRPFNNKATSQQVSQNHGRYPHWGADGVLHFISLDRYASCAPPFKECTYTDINLDVTPDKAPGTIAFRNATVVTGIGETVISNADLIIREGRIECVGDCDESTVDQSSDLSGKFVIPGLVSVHEHDTSDGPDVLRSRAPNVSKFLAYGVTTIMEPAPSSDTVLAQAELVETGRGIGPRIFSTGRPIYGWAPERHLIKVFSDAEENVRRLAGKGAIGIKQYFELRRHQRQWLAEAARQNGPTLLTGEMMDLHYFLGAIMDGHTTLEHENTYWPYFYDFREFIRQSGTQVSITSTTPARGRYLMEYFTSGQSLPDDPREVNFTAWDYLHRQGHDSVAPLSEYESIAYLQDLKELVQEDVIFGAGGHGEVPGLDQHWELWSFALHSGPMKAIEAVTIRSAEYLGLSRDIGSIEVGKLGDLLILNSDPLVNIRNSTDAAYVVKNGRVYDPETLDQIWPNREAYGARPWVAPDTWSGVGRVGRPLAVKNPE